MIFRSDKESTRNEEMQAELRAQIKRPVPIVTYVLIGLNILVYVAMFIAQRVLDLSQTEVLVLFGAKVNVLISLGQYWRLFTCMFIHIGFLHLLCNCWAIYVFGRTAEMLFGRVKTIIIYLIAGLAGSVASFVFSNAIGAGASGAIFGIVGSFFYMWFKNREIFKRVFGPTLLIVLGINFFIGVTQQGVDLWAHLVGLLFGLLSAFVVGFAREKVQPLQRYVTLFAIIVFITAGIIYATGLWGI